MLQLMPRYAAYIDCCHGGQAGAIQLYPRLLQRSPELAQTIRIRISHLHNVKAARKYPGHALFELYTYLMYISFVA